MRGFQRTRVSTRKVSAAFGLKHGARNQLLGKSLDICPLIHVEARVVYVEAIRFSHSNYLSEMIAGGTQCGAMHHATPTTSARSPG